MKLRLVTLEQRQDFDAQARELLARLRPSAVAAATVAKLEDAWTLAQYVDLVEAGYGLRDAAYELARKALQEYVAQTWQQRANRKLFSRSAAMMAYVNDQLEGQVADMELDVTEAIRELAA